MFSDVHANLHALEAIWAHIEREVPDTVYCLGDLVGYGAYPNEVIEFIKSRDIPTVMGNYDEGVGFDLHDCEHTNTKDSSFQADYLFLLRIL